MDKIMGRARKYTKQNSLSETYVNPTTVLSCLDSTKPVDRNRMPENNYVENLKKVVSTNMNKRTSIAEVESKPTDDTFSLDVNDSNLNIEEKPSAKAQRRRLLRSFTLASIPSSFDKTNRKFHLAKAPLKVKFLVSPKGTAWYLEEEIEQNAIVECDTHTDSTPFGYNSSSQTYYSSAPASPDAHAEARKKKVIPPDLNMSPRASISLENIHRLRVSSSKLTLDCHDEQSLTPEAEDEKVSSVSLEEKGRALRRSFSFSQRNFRRNAVIETSSETMSVKTKRKRDNILEAFFKAVEHQDSEQIAKLLSTTDVDVNEFNDDGFSPLDISLMLQSDSITSQLLEHNARESNRLSASLLENHLKMLQTFAEEQVEQYVADVVNKGSTDAKDSEKHLKECEWRLHLLKKMLVGFQGLQLPSRATTVFLSAASETSLLVRFSGPVGGKTNPVTKFRVQWSREKAFDNLDGEYFSHDVLDRQYIITGLQKSIAYYVRVSVGNIKGYGEWMISCPPCVVPSSWHEIDDSIPRFQGKLDQIAKLFEEVQIHQTNSRIPRETKSFRLRRSPQMHRKRASSWHVVTGSDVYYLDRKDSKKRTFAKYAKLLTSTPKFVKEVKRGIYLATLFYTKDDKILVTLDDNLPIVEVDDHSAGSFTQEFQWLLKVGCTWQDIKLLKDQVERNLSSTTVYLRGRLLQALDTLQAGVGCDDLGQLHYQIIKDKNGTNIIVITKRIKNPSFIRSRTLSMKWTSLSKLERKSMTRDTEDTPSALNLVKSSIQDMISYHQQTKKPLEKGLYLGLMKLRTSVDSINITVPRHSPNILPYVKVRDNPHVSREEWEWLTGLATTPSEDLASETPPSFQSTLEHAVKTLLDDIGISRQECADYRIYDREVVELSKDVSLLILVPSPKDVCSCPGDGDIFSNDDRFLSIPVPVFEMNVMKTYQNQFICHYSRLSSILDMALLISQHDCRKAILDDEVKETKATQNTLSNFQKELDETWKGMRWLLDILHYTRDRECVSGIPLDLIFDTQRPCGPEADDCHRKHSELKNLSTLTTNSDASSLESGVLKIYSSCETGLAPGRSVKLHVSSDTTVEQVVYLVVRQLEKLVQQKNPDTKLLTEEKVKEFCLVAVIGARERCLSDDYKILQLQNPWVKGKLFVRLRVEAIAANNRSTSTLV